MRSRYCRKLIVILLLSGGLTAHADIYRWIDEAGQVHYTDQQQGEKSQGIKSYSGSGTAPGSAQDRMEKTRRLLNAYRLERRQKREQQAKQKAQEEKRLGNCNRARDDVRRYAAYRRVYRLDNEGNRVYLSDQERISILQRSKQNVARWCS